MNDNLFSSLNDSGYANIINHYKKVFKNLMLAWHIICILLYTAFSLVVILKDYGSVYTKILLGFLVAYVVIYVLVLILNYVGAKNVSSKLKDITIVITILKQLLTIFNLVMSIMAFISSFSIKKVANLFSIFVAVISIIIAVIIILVNLFKLFIKYYAKKKMSNIQNMFSNLNLNALGVSNNKLNYSENNEDDNLDDNN